MKTRGEWATALGPKLRKALADQRHLVRSFHGVRDLIENPAGDRAWSGALADRLRKLAAELEGHYAGEEAPGGFYASLAAEFPWVKERLFRLEAEHPRILEAVRRAAADAAALAADDARGAAALVSRIEMALATEERHESEENELLQKLFNDTSGAGD